MISVAMPADKKSEGCGIEVVSRMKRSDCTKKVMADSAANKVRLLEDNDYNAWLMC
jgi:hypothetical protein